MTAHKNYLHILWRIPAMLLWLLFMPSLFFILRLLKVPFYQTLPHYFHRGMQVILGLRVTFSGASSDQSPCLYVSNHISYLDVFVLGGVRAFYIAKSEVASWPVLGYLARFQNTLFFERSSGKAKQQLSVMREHLHGGESLILFPEGTSTEGVHVEPFKSSLFAAADLTELELKSDQNTALKRVAIQPITVAYTHLGGKKMDQEARDYCAWYGTTPFFPHFKSLFSLKKVNVKVYFHPVCYLDEFETRKQCAQHCQEMVARKLDDYVSQ